MSKPRVLLVILTFVGLAALELGMGFSRLSALREGRVRELRQQVERGHDGLARELRAALGASDRVARLLAELHGTTGLLDRPDTLLSGMVMLPDVARLIVLDDRREVTLDVARGGEGQPLLRADRTPPDARVLEACDRGVALPRDLALSGPLVTAPIPDDGGFVVLGLDAAPFAAALAAFEPVDGGETRWLTGGGADGTGAHDDGDGGLVIVSAAPLDGPGFLLRTDLPATSLERAMAPIAREYAFVVGSMIVVTLALGVVGALVLRLGVRAMRLHETEHYLRWIRRVTDRYRALMEGAADMLLVLEPDGTLREANAAARDVFGLPTPGDGGPTAAETAVVRPVEDWPGDDGERLRAAVRSAAEQPGRSVAESALRLRDAGGGERVVDAHVAGVDVGGEQLVEVSLRDVTHQRAVEVRLRTAERLGSLGLLTAGVAHEINNPLEGMVNYLSLLERDDLDGERRLRYVGELRRGMHRVRDIVQDLLSFARPSLEGGRADLVSVVDEAVGLARYAKEFRDVTVEREGCERALPVAGDAGRLVQVLLNLLLNAGRAMEGAGRIRVVASRRRADDGGERVLLDVIDEGPGLPPDAAGRLFDPFFSGSGGTGLGLAVSFGIIEAHGGTLSAHDAPGGGARFRVELPAADESGQDPQPGDDAT